MNRNQVLEVLNGGPDEDGWTPDALDLLLSSMPDAERKFRKVDKALIKFLSEVREHFPDAQYYTASGGFTLLLGSPHDERTDRPRHELSVLAGLAQIGDGDW